jgi:hypothetical protein
MAQAKPCWSWTGVAELTSSGRGAPLRDPVAKLPVKKSSDEQIVDYLADLRDHFHRWLHQDEFGPDRKQQTANRIPARVDEIFPNLATTAHKGLVATQETP